MAQLIVRYIQVPQLGASREEVLIEMGDFVVFQYQALEVVKSFKSVTLLLQERPQTVLTQVQ